MYQIDFSNPIHIHFIGIGGISMSGLAEILLAEGFTISGSDMRHSALTDMLEGKGVHIFYRQSAENLTDDIDLVVYTAAIHKDNPEFAAIAQKDFRLLPEHSFLDRLCAITKYRLPSAAHTAKQPRPPWFPRFFCRHRQTLRFPSVVFSVPSAAISVSENPIIL